MDYTLVESSCYFGIRIFFVVVLVLVVGGFAVCVVIVGGGRDGGGVSFTEARPTLVI